MPLVLCLIGHVVSLPFHIICVASKGFSHLYSVLVSQIAISIQLLFKHSKQLKKINPFSWSSVILELTNKLKRLPKESSSWRKLIHIDVCVPLIASYAYDILTLLLKREKEWSGVKD